MLLIFLAVALSFVLASIIGLLIYARWNYGTLEALNIPVVKRSFFLGSTPDLHKAVQHLEDIRRYKKYGPIYGVYEGRTPHIHICDPEIIRMIFVRDFDHFRDRRDVSLGHAILDNALDFLPYDQWKVLRQMATPSLTSSKLKVMSDRVNEIAIEFLPHLEKEVTLAGGRMKVGSRKVFVPISVDTIVRGLCGIKVRNPFDYGGALCQNAEGLTADGGEPSMMYTLGATFPFLSFLAPTFDAKNVNFLADFFRNARKVRLADAFRQNDFMDKFVDMMEKLNTEEFNRLKITEDIVLGQIVVPLLAGYDAIATAFSFLSYYAATEPGVQQRIQEEVDSYFERHGEFKYENMGELEYLNACVLETLRLVPSFIRPERICTKDWEYNGLRIPKGCIVMIPAWAANRNPEIYPDPEKFYPDRFLGDDGKNLNPYGFSTFGHGPRNCIGRKFAIDAIKIALFHVFRKFRFEAREDTRVTYKTGKVILFQTNPIYLDVLLRQ